MSYLNTRQALFKQLLDNLPSGLNSDDVAFENGEFDPESKSLWLAVYFMPATTESTSKSAESSDEDRGVLQVSVFARLNGDSFDNAQLAVVDEIRTIFKHNTVMVYNGQKVQTVDSTFSVGSESEAWFQRNISINYLTFSNK